LRDGKRAYPLNSPAAVAMKHLSFLAAFLRSEGERGNRSDNGRGKGCGSHRSVRSGSLDELGDFCDREKLQGRDHRSEVVASDDARGNEGWVASFLLIDRANVHLAEPFVVGYIRIRSAGRIVQVFVTRRNFSWRRSAAKVIVIDSAVLITGGRLVLSSICPSGLQSCEIII